MLVHKLINVRSINILGYFRIGAFDSIDLPLILFKPDECFTNFLYKCWSNCNNILLLQFLSLRFRPKFLKQFRSVDQRLSSAIWWTTMFANHSLSSSSFFFGFSDVTLYYSVSCFVIFDYNSWKTGEISNNIWTYIYIDFNILIWNIYYFRFRQNSVLLI